MTLPGKPGRGFVLGKFMPPHRGHVFLCDFARAYCDRLTILVCSLADDPIPGELRHRWMSALFPDCEVRWCAEPLPQEPAEHSQFWPIWRDVVMRYGSQPDVVFASEDYGHRLAAEVEARFVPVDPARLAVPTSATAIREAPFTHWRFLPEIVRPYFAKRICVFGPESTGKTMLADALARRFDASLVPEYGRTYTHAFGTTVQAEDLARIVQGHLAARAAAEKLGRRLLIEDTDPLLTAVWSDMLTGARSDAFAGLTRHADLYLLCDVDVPWVDDGTRYFPAPQDRSRFFDACRAELEARGLPYALVSGADWRQREQKAVAAILKAFPGLEAGA